MGMRCRAVHSVLHTISLIFLYTLSSSDCSAANSDHCLLQQRCGEVIVSYPFALAERSDCPSFSPFFLLTCDPSTHHLFLPNITSWPNNSTGYMNTSLPVKHISDTSLIVDVTALNASLPSLSPLPNGSCVSNAIIESGFQLPPYPGPFFISDDNEFASFGCTIGILATTKLLPLTSFSPAASSPVSSPLASPLPPSAQQQQQIGSPAHAPAPAPAPISEDVPSKNYADVEVRACAVICPGTLEDHSASLCGDTGRRDCCVTPLAQNSASRYADYMVLQSLFASNISCKGGTNYATLFHRSSSDLNRGNYYLKLMWALPSNHTQNLRELLQSPDYACSANASFTIVDGVPGYLCSCNLGYKGDGYLKGLGCRDIDECGDPAISNDCVSMSKCENSPPGNYTCKCKAPFYVGDGRKNGSGCQFSHRLRLALQISAVIVLVALMMGIFFCIAIWWRRRTKEKYFIQHGGLELQEILRSRSGRETKIFKAEELTSATDNYADHMKLGVGGFGTVFKGVLKDKTVVAIKKANVRKGYEGDREQFLNEMAILVRINHRHIVRLLGCCLETAVPLLVYEFVSNGNLEQNLRGNNGTLVMGWQQRLEVARQTAEALAYLHAAASPPILHRDVKSANVLLDDNFDAKVADFGLSRLVLDKVEEAATAIQGGTIGYLDPEYFQTFELTEKSDVYSLGVMLVELISGLKPVDSSNREPSLALRFIHHMEEGKLEELIDARLDHNLSATHSSIMAVAALARRCLHLQGSRRPFMSDVVDKLHHIVQSMKCGHDKDEDENAPLLSCKENYETMEYGKAGAIMPDDPHSQSCSIQSGSIQNVLLNAPTLPR